MGDPIKKIALADIFKTAKTVGFECWGSLPAHQLNVNAEVRSMCRANLCKSFDKNWVCPPACGTLEEYSKTIKMYTDCVIVQTVFTLEDEFDIEGMQRAELLHKERFNRFIQATRSNFCDVSLPSLALAAGTCTRCPQCSYPEQPCRFPSKAHVSMEAAGLLVSDTCNAAGIPYYHGKNTITYVSCLIF